MIILFNIDFKVEPGEMMCIHFIRPNGDVSAEQCRSIDTQRMNNDNGHFSYTLRLDRHETERLTKTGYLDYYYSIENSGQPQYPIPVFEGTPPPKKEEWTSVMHRIDISQTGMDRYTIYDHWQYRPDDAHLYTPAFTECLQHRELETPHHRPAPAILRLKVRAPQLRSNEHLFLVGAHPALGEWDTRRSIPCHEQQPGEWVASIDTEYTANEDIEYKFIVISQEPSTLNYTMWETGGNRRVLVPRLRKGEVMEYELNQAFFEIWRARKVGTSVSLDDIYKIGGIGITNLRRLVDWIGYTRQQILLIHSVPEKVSDILEKRLTELHHYAKKKGVLLIMEEQFGDARITKEGITLTDDCLLPPQVMTQQEPSSDGVGRGLLYMMIGKAPYLNPDNYPYLSVCTIDTHTATALTDWWEEDKERTQCFYSEIMGRRDDAPHPLPSWLARDIISRNLHSASIFCIFSLADWKLINEEVLTCNIKDLLHNSRFCDDIAELIKQSGRC